MIMEYIDRANFDTRLGKILKGKKNKNIVVGRYDIEGIDLDKKSDFIIKFILSLKSVKGITYKVLFWEKDDILKEFIRLNFFGSNFNITMPYKNGKLPGIFFIDDNGVEERFLKILLDNHFNYEMAKDPSLNLRVQICINQEEFITLLDVYDDRGFDIYYIADVSRI